MEEPTEEIVNETDGNANEGTAEPPRMSPEDFESNSIKALNELAVSDLPVDLPHSTPMPMARRNSDPAAVTINTSPPPTPGFGPGPDAELPSPPMRKSNSVPIMSEIESSRHEGVRVSPEALARLHQRNEQLRKEREGTTNEDGVTEEQMDSVWGQEGSWQVWGSVPHGQRERPMTWRSLQAFPKGSESNLASRGIAMANTKGKKGEHDDSIGQDCCSVSMLSSKWEVLSVFDGHGSMGEWPAARAARTLPYLLETDPSCVTMLNHDQVEAALFHAFVKVQNDLVCESEAEDIDLQATGSTAACILLDPQRQFAWVATVGDSRALLLAPGRGVVAQTRDHKPSVPSELQRVESCGMELVTTEHGDGFLEQRLNIPGEGLPGLCMTRSLGDLCVKEYGVIADPEVLKWRLNAFEKVVLLAASDGVWEFLTSEDVAKIVLDRLEAGGSCDDSCRDVIKAAQESWGQHEQDYCDDITAVIVSISRDPNTMAWGVKEDGCCSAGLRRAGCTIQ